VKIAGDYYAENQIEIEKIVESKARKLSIRFGSFQNKKTENCIVNGNSIEDFKQELRLQAFLGIDKLLKLNENPTDKDIIYWLQTYLENINMHLEESNKAQKGDYKAVNVNSDSIFYAEMGDGYDNL
jgi:hypothetical protein